MSSTEIDLPENSTEYLQFQAAMALFAETKATAKRLAEQVAELKVEVLQTGVDRDNWAREAARFREQLDEMQHRLDSEVGERARIEAVIDSCSSILVGALRRRAATGQAENVLRAAKPSVFNRVK